MMGSTASETTGAILEDGRRVKGEQLAENEPTDD
jgi:hypothetical protein